MTTQNHFRLLDKYRAYEEVIHDLLASILTSLEGELLLNNVEQQQATIRHLAKAYPLVDLVYCLDSKGM